MAVSDAVASEVPVREGEYGDRVAAIEPGGVEYIALSERHGKPIDLFFTWLSPNLEFSTFFVGCLAVFLFGASFLTAVMAIIVGNVLGSITQGILSTWGPRFGVPQMVQSRAAFGFIGNLLPAGLNTFAATVGWFIVNSVSGAFALQAFTQLPFNVTFTIIVLLQIVVAFFGHNLVHAFERYALIPLAIIFVLACGFVLAHTNPGAAGNGNQFTAFMLAAATAYGYAVGWNPYASDYTRYQRPDASRTMIGVWAGLGVGLSCIVLEIAGAGLVTVAGTKWGATDIPTAQLALTMPDFLYKATLLAIALGAVAANAINIYSGAMSFLTLGIRLSMKQRRAIVAVLAGVISLILGIAFQTNVAPGGKYEGFLLVLGYWIAPWLGVILTDYWMRRGNFGNERVFYDRSYRPWQGFVAMAIATIVSILLFSNQALYTGLVAKAAPAIGDLTFVVGFILAAALYFAFHRGRIAVDVGGETAIAV